MSTDIFPGDLVDVAPWEAGSFRPAIVISVQKTNDVPDAYVRGLANVYPYSYWLFFPENTDDHNMSLRGVRGPFMRSEIHRVRT